MKRLKRVRIIVFFFSCKKNPFYIHIFYTFIIQ